MVTIHTLQQYFSWLHFSELGITVIIINLLTLAGSGFLIRQAAKNRSEKTIKRRVKALRAINIAILTIYFLAGIFGFPPGQKFAKQILCLMIAIGANFLVQSWILSRFGNEREIEGKAVMTSSHTSNMIGLLALTLIVALTIIALLNIWELHSWLQASSIIGAFILIIYACKDYLLSDIISSLVLHYNRTIEPGNVIRIPELNIYGVVQQITLTQTTVRDIIHRHVISVTNSRIRQSVIENLSQSTGHIRDFIDFKVGYDHRLDEVEEGLKKAWQQVKDKNKLLEDNVLIHILENDDHAVIWRMSYWVNNPYKLMEVKAQLNERAFECCHKNGIYLNTPLTHQVQTGE